MTYLGKQTGTKLSIKIAPSYLAHINTVGSDKADLAFVGPSPYVRIHDKYGGIELLARFRMRDDIGDKIVIFCRADSPLNQIADLTDRTFAFGDHQSYGSHFLPRWLLHKAGVSVRMLLAYDFVKSHDNVVLSVLHGDFSAGGARLDVFEKYSNRPLRILAGPVTTPPHALICSTDLAPGLADSFRQGLLQLKDRTILNKIHPDMEGFDPVTDSDFDQARQVMNFIEAR